MEKIIKIGAEATISSTKWFEVSAISKIRHKKNYRPVEIDNLIRVQRTIKEANIMNKTRLLKIDVPIIYFVDPNNAEIIMEKVDGPRIKEYLDNKNIDCEGIGWKIGHMVGKLHKNNIIHGDLTTSNMIIRKNNNICLIDFGLANQSNKLEDKGVDIRLLKGILNSAHNDVFKIVFNNFLVGYESIMKNSFEQIISIVKQIEMRGRYARVD
jgi:TP53 regulating kinase-like protein|tara:strand:- start:357 stop:989 length:633 start_codon:yes stop_codon:yes gene_type:complete